MTGRIDLLVAARRVIVQAGRRALPLETGGILIGHRDGENVIVTRAVEVPSPTATRRSYRLDHEHADAALARALRNQPRDALAGYVGEWHTHPARVGPSILDRMSIASAARKSPAPIAMIVCHPAAQPRFWGVLPVARHGLTLGLSTVASMMDEIENRLGLLPSGAVRMSGPVFVSYRHNDGATRARQLERLFRAAGIVVWRDQSDLRAGTTEDRLEIALTNGLSAATLVVTKDIANSTVIKERELPRLLQLDEDPGFSLTIADEVLNADGRPDFGAADRLLGLTPERVLHDKKQSNSRTQAGRLEIVRDLVAHRLETRRTDITVRGNKVDIMIQTRPAPTAMDADLGADLHIRIPAPPGTQKVPTRASMQALQQTLPISSDAAHATGAQTISVRGGAHLSIALTLGAAFPQTRFATLEVIDRFGNVWASHADGTVREINESHLPLASPDANGPVAVAVALTANPDTHAFDALVAAGEFAAAVRLDLTDFAALDPGEGGALASELADRVKRIGREKGRSQVHLAFQGPFSMAVLLGRLLNTVRTVVYEWDDTATPATYRPVVTLGLGYATSPIVAVNA
jgi:integrative and conjugative element protein (TIGR02256 family)